MTEGVILRMMIQQEQLALLELTPSIWYALS